MNDGKLNEEKNRLMADIDLPDKELQIYRKILDFCLTEEGTDERYLSIQIGNSQGNLKRYGLSFNLSTALTLVRTAIELTESELDIKQWVLILLTIVANLFRQENISLDSVQIRILIELYENQRRKRRDLMEEDLYEQVRKNEGNNEISKKAFDEALENLRKLKCIEVTQGFVTLVERVEVDE
ncbi:MAG: hypothetical protein K2N95_19190 [Lachnospiraceae bacterium]|nr:hypothetical protein [Lachnospiraceae bacterium]